MAIKHIGQGNFVDGIPVEGYPNIYPYVVFHSLQRASYGLAKIIGGNLAEWDDYIEIGNTSFENAGVPEIDYNNAIEALEDGGKSIFEEYPFVEVRSEEDYIDAMMATGDYATRDAAKDDAHWEGPGMYDFRDRPFSFSGTPEEEEIKNMEFWADDTIEYVFQGDEWKEAAESLSTV